MTAPDPDRAPPAEEVEALATSLLAAYPDLWDSADFEYFDGHEIAAMLRGLAADNARLRAERDALRREAGKGCDASEGGHHVEIRDGRYRFCTQCGETLRGPAPTAPEPSDTGEG